MQSSGTVNTSSQKETFVGLIWYPFIIKSLAWLMKGRWWMNFSCILVRLLILSSWKKLFSRFKMWLADELPEGQSLKGCGEWGLRTLRAQFYFQCIYHQSGCRSCITIRKFDTNNNQSGGVVWDKMPCRGLCVVNLTSGSFRNRWEGRITLSASSVG